MKYGLVDWAANCAVDYLWENGRHDKRGYEQILNDSKDFEDARRAHDTIRDKAADTGTDIHELCQLWLENRPRILNISFNKATNDMKIMFDSFKKWATKNKIEPVHTEIKLHGSGYSGRCDLIAYRTCPKTGVRRLGLYDIKTGKGSYYKEWGLQLAAYAEAYIADPFREGELPLSEIGIIKLNKDTLKCNFSEQSKPKFTLERDKLAKAFMLLKDFYWCYNSLQNQFDEINKSGKEQFLA